MAVATNANVLWGPTPTGGPFAATAVNGAITFTDAQAALLLEADFDSTNPPMTLGTIAPVGLGEVEAVVLMSFLVTIPAEGTNPWTGADVIAGGVFEVLYVEVCKQCNGEPSLAVGGERFTLVAATSGAQPLGWTRISTGRAAGFAEI
jgi:hypothetical protein